MLSRFSSGVADRLFAVYPEWRALASQEPYGDGTAYLVVEFAAPPAARTDRGLLITTDDEEVTVSFDWYHSHCGRLCQDEDGHEAADEAIELIGRILSEDVGVVSRWSGTKWCGSYMVDACEVGGVLAAPRQAGVYALHTAAGDPIDDGADHLRIRSWRGMHNADIDL